MQQRNTAAHGHGRSGRSRKQGQVAQRARYGAKAPGGEWGFRPVGLLGSSPLAVSSGVAGRPLATLSYHASGRQRGAGVPDLVVWCKRTQGRTLVENIEEGSRVLFLAVCASSGTPERGSCESSQRAQAAAGHWKKAQAPTSARVGTYLAGRGCGQNR